MYRGRYSSTDFVCAGVINHINKLYKLAVNPNYLGLFLPSAVSMQTNTTLPLLLLLFLQVLWAGPTIASDLLPTSFPLPPICNDPWTSTTQRATLLSIQTTPSLICRDSGATVQRIDASTCQPLVHSFVFTNQAACSDVIQFTWNTSSESYVDNEYVVISTQSGNAVGTPFSDGVTTLPWSAFQVGPGDDINSYSYSIFTPAEPQTCTLPIPYNLFPQRCVTYYHSGVPFNPTVMGRHPFDIGMLVAWSFFYVLRLSVTAFRPTKAWLITAGQLTGTMILIMYIPALDLAAAAAASSSLFLLIILFLAIASCHCRRTLKTPYFMSLFYNPSLRRACLEAVLVPVLWYVVVVSFTP
jgi:hypothetical protein